ncbi:MAG: DUF535 family protein [Desulfocapsaceae bacterium]|nr:DUF535 family protein [Desulfocapsaceae bacterium]
MVEWLVLCLRGSRILFFIHDHFKLRKTLSSLHRHRLLCPRVKVYYLFDYLSVSLTTRKKLKIINCHYAFLQRTFPFHIIKKIYGDGLTFWSETREGNSYEISLKTPSPFEREGPLLLDFTMNGTALYCMGFSFAPGKCFGVRERIILFISRIQGYAGRLKEISVCTKAFGENKPSTLLLSIVEGMALGLGVESLIGISTNNQLACLTADYARNYDRFWESFESTKISSGDYYLELPLKNKDLFLIPSKHRRRTLKKRATRREIALKVYAHFSKMNLLKNEVQAFPLECPES